MHSHIPGKISQNEISTPLDSFFQRIASSVDNYSSSNTHHLTPYSKVYILLKLTWNQPKWPTLHLAQTTNIGAYFRKNILQINQKVPIIPGGGPNGTDIIQMQPLHKLSMTIKFASDPTEHHPVPLIYNGQHRFPYFNNHHLVYLDLLNSNHVVMLRKLSKPFN